MRPLVGTFLIVVGLGRPGPADCQRLAPLVSSSRATLLLAPGALRGTALLSDSVHRAIPRTHWLEGGLIGGGALGLAAAVLNGGLCYGGDSGNHDCAGATLEGFVFGGGLGFLVGSLIGGQFPKKGARLSVSPIGSGMSVSISTATIRIGDWGVGLVITAAIPR